MVGAEYGAKTTIIPWTEPALCQQSKLVEVGSWCGEGFLGIRRPVNTNQSSFEC